MVSSKTEYTIIAGIENTDQNKSNPYSVLLTLGNANVIITKPSDVVGQGYVPIINISELSCPRANPIIG